MTIRLGQVAPDFEQDTANGSIRFHAWLGASWGLLFSYPANAELATMAELVGVTLLQEEWRRRTVKPVALGIDSADGAGLLAGKVEETQGRAVNFPIVADSDGRVAALYGMLYPGAGLAILERQLLLIDPMKRVRLKLAYPVGIGRSFQEVLRVIDGLQS